MTAGIVLVPIELATLQGELLAAMDVARSTVRAEVRSLRAATRLDLGDLADTAHGHVAARIQAEIGELVGRTEAQLERTVHELRAAARAVERARDQAIADDTWLGGIAIRALAELAERSARHDAWFLPSELRALRGAGRSAHDIRGAVERGDYDGLERAVDAAWSRGRFPGDAHAERFYAQQLVQLLGGKHVVVAVRMLDELRGPDHWPRQDRFQALFARATFARGGLGPDVDRAVFHPGNAGVLLLLAARPEALSNQARGRAAAVLATTGHEHDTGLGSPEALVTRLLATGRSRQSFLRGLMELPHLDVLRLRDERLQTLLAGRLDAERRYVRSRLGGAGEQRAFDVFAAASGSPDGRATVVRAGNEDLARALALLVRIRDTTELTRSSRYFGAALRGLHTAAELQNDRRERLLDLAGLALPPVVSRTAGAIGKGLVPVVENMLPVAELATDEALRNLVADADYDKALARVDFERVLRRALRNDPAFHGDVEAKAKELLDRFQGATMPGAGLAVGGG